MSKQEANNEFSMRNGDTIVMFGSGRWGRTLGQILLRETPYSLQYVTRSADRACELQLWASGLGQGTRVSVTSAPEPSTDNAFCAFAANAARDHEAAALFALSRKLPVLVEKPIALSAASARRMLDAATLHGQRLALSNVFRFAEYFESFRQELSQAGAWHVLRLTWTDARAEDRHGMVKTYDASISVIADVLPHVVSILDWLRPGASIAFRRLDVEFGGQVVHVQLEMQGCPCVVELGRNRDRRRRLLEVDTDAARCHLDFAAEPATIRRDGAVIAAGDGQKQDPSPLTRQALTFLSDPADPRLTPSVGIQACLLVDEMQPLYSKARDESLDDAVSKGMNQAEADVQYAALEQALEIAPNRDTIAAA